ncbi:chemotaxis protein CheW [Kushneria aurantia]|uniref:Chemotaxis protein CheW n=1 Tax=Kushneria aurantia TaxID=504092 RepID=A0ABV6G798_9GAMM|nr:chemotaxis protein CheW [Kushneria aurantia]
MSSSQAQTSDDSGVVICRLGGERFALPMRQVSGVLRRPAIRRLPMSQQALLGLASLRGSVVPIIALHHLLGLACDRDGESDSRIVMMELEQTLGICVDDVENVVSLPAESAIGAAEETTRSGVRGHHLDSEGRVIQWLDVARLVQEQLVPVERKAVPTPSGAAQTASPDPGTPQYDSREQNISLVSFTLAEQHFALHLEHVRQILRLPEEVSAVPNAPDYLLGLMTLRDETLPLLALGPWFGLAGLPEAGAPVVVLGLGEYRIGVVVDGVNQVVRLAPAALRGFPALSTGGPDAGIEAICRPAADQPLMTLLSEQPFRKLAEQYGVPMAASRDVRDGSEAVDEGEDDDESLRLLEFSLAGQQYSLPLEAVTEIASRPEAPTQVPATPEFLDGMINLRGDALPIVDMAKRLGVAPEVSGDDRSGSERRIVVVSHRGMKTGLLVDVVNNVMHVRRSWLEASPVVMLGREVLVDRLVRLPDSRDVIQLLTLEALFSADERAQLDEMSGDVADAPLTE